MNDVGRKSGGRKTPWLLACVIACLLGSGLMYRHGLAGEFPGDVNAQALGADDAYIAFRYALNASRGLGPVWNVGERVEGYSAPGFVLLLVPFAWLGKAWLYPAAVGLGVAGLVGCVLLVHVWGMRVGGRQLALLLALVVATWPAAHLWSVSGLETCWMMFFQLGLVMAVRTGGSRRALFLMALGCSVVRSDGFVLVVIVAGWLLLQAKEGRRALRWTTLGGTCGALAVLCFRIAYYGQVLPNTAVAKVTGGLPVRIEWAALDMLVFAFMGGLIVLPAAWAAGLECLEGLSAASRRQWTAVRAGGRRMTLEGWVILGWLAYFVAIGGDVYADRFLTFLLPIGAAWLLCRVKGRWQLALAVTMVAMQMLPLVYDRRFRPVGVKRDLWLEVGQFLGRIDRDGGLLATDMAGKIPFAAEVPTLDILGLNDFHLARVADAGRQVGHMKFDPDYVLGRQPEWIACRTVGDLESLDLSWGLSRDKYLAAGYDLAYLWWDVVDKPPPDPDGWLVDVWGMSADHKLALVRMGYGAGILGRRDAGLQ